MRWLKSNPHQQALSVEELQVLCHQSPLSAQADALTEAINSLEKTGWIDKAAGRYWLNEGRGKSANQKPPSSPGGQTA